MSIFVIDWIGLLVINDVWFGEGLFGIVCDVVLVFEDGCVVVIECSGVVVDECFDVVGCCVIFGFVDS